MQTQTLPRWIAKRGNTTLKVRAADIHTARERCASIGMPDQVSIVLDTDHDTDRAAAVRALKLIEANMRTVADSSRAAILRRAVAEPSFRPAQVYEAIEHADIWLDKCPRECS